MMKKRDAIFLSLLIGKRLIALAALILAVLSTFHYIPNVLLDIVIPYINSVMDIDPIPNRFSDINVGINFTFLPYLFLIFICYPFNFILVSTLISAGGDLVELLAIRRELGVIGFKKYKAFAAIKRKRIEGIYDAQERRRAYKEKRREAMKRKYGGSDSGAGALLAGILLGMFLS
ncbi:hypothetical protein IBN99_004422 [Salmonella enterica]|uniref:hypothetical protein n=1 Tax=Escherichia coli TaxID=562 RepID=UPI00199D41F2|nr:hypothetical protein [Escherichia coli]EGF1003068.1 hypothetical protein [Salmonella enterica]EIC9104052.1 hypothetical protein [Salmonella enterica]EJI2458877.1 hypothetical protein [Salmonella enterica]EJS5106644.1 hypothetical protein [Salmonella enterica]MDY7643340.1 hypothetical protein [Escherichia coli]